MADAIKKEFKVDSKLIEGSGGVFDVQVEGQAIWSKRESGRFPEHEEVLSLIRSLPIKAK